MFGVPRLRIKTRRRRRRKPAPHSKRAQQHYREHKESARTLVRERLQFWSIFFEVEHGRVAIRNTRTRWGSCSSKRNLNFSYRLKFLPQELIDYVVVHELCHLIEFNHSPAFWAHVERALPEYRHHRNALRELHPMAL